MATRFFADLLNIDKFVKRAPGQKREWWPRELLSIPRSKSGVSVTMDSALTMAAVFACIRILAEDMAKLPLHVYRERPGGRGKDRAKDHYLYDLLKIEPNSEMSSFSWRESMQAWLGAWGNAYTHFRVNGRGQIYDLFPLQAKWVKPKRQNGVLYYEYSPDGIKPEKYPAANILHLHAFGFDGLMGYSPIHMARETIGLGLAAQEYGSRFFSNDARPGIVLETPTALSDPAYERLRAELESENAGLINAHKPTILEEGLKIHEVGIPPEDAQFLQTRQFQVAEVARWYRMPPHKIQDLLRSTNNNIEHQSLEYVVDTLLPWITRWEQEATRKFLTPRERKQGYYIAFLINGLLRGDIQSRYAAYHTAKNDGWMNGDEIREKEDMNPMPDDLGKTYYVPLNMIPAQYATSIPTGNQSMEENARSMAKIEQRHNVQSENRAREIGANRHKLIGRYLPLFRDASQRIVNGEARNIRREMAKIKYVDNVSEFRVWMDDYYKNENPDFVKRQLMPVLTAYADPVAESVIAEGNPIDGDYSDNVTRYINEYANQMATRHSGRHLHQLQNVVERSVETGADPYAEIDHKLNEFVDTKPEIIAREESVRANNALAVMLFGMAGVVYLRWVAMGKSCPYCNELNGRIVGIQEYFLASGSILNPPGAESPLTINKSKRHPPAHGGCDCLVISG
jgi:HK97 family phage portal protein